MVKEKEIKMEKEKSHHHHHHHHQNIAVGPTCSFPDVKFLAAAAFVSLFFLSALLVPYKPFLTVTEIRSCLSSLSTPSPPQPTPLTSAAATDSSNQSDYKLVSKRSFVGVGSAAYLFVQMGAYRGGGNTFAVVGLSSKPLHVFSTPDLRCRWAPKENSSNSTSGTAYKILPDWGYGRVYTVVVVNCTFANDVGADGSGGQLVISIGDEHFVALDEAPASVNMSIYSSRPELDYLYCGSSLYGAPSPQRVREWIAYHAKLFGPRSHFVIHDAGGVHPEVREVLRPWIEKGFVTLQDITDQERFDGYYHNQFLVVNDCLHRYRFRAKWVFFFDVDEFIYVEPRSKSLATFMDSMSEFTQFTIEQMTMSSKLCLSEDAGKNWRMWGMEKLVYRDVKRGIRRDRKYAIQPRSAYAVGVHLSQNFNGKTTHKTEGRIKYFHYHGTIANRREPCREFVNATELTFEGTPYVRDDTLRRLAGSVKMFEVKTIGSALRRTRQ